MTLIISLISQMVSLQASDRRTTIPALARIHDSEANKTVVYRASDGIASISYCGLAYVNRETPTDTWIAQTLAELGAHRTQSLHFAMLGLARAIDNLFAKPITPHNAAALFVNGWRWSHRRPERPVPVFGRIAGHLKDQTYKLTWRRAVSVWNGFAGSFAPTGWVPGADLEAFYRAIERLTFDELLEALRTKIQDVSRNHLEVGPDIMTVVIRRPKPTRRVVEIYFEPADPTVGVDDPSSVTFTPWFVSGPRAAEPRQIVGNMSLIFGYDDFYIYCSRVGRIDRLRERVVLLMVQQRRKQAPS